MDEIKEVAAEQTTHESASFVPRSAIASLSPDQKDHIAPTGASVNVAIELSNAGIRVPSKSRFAVFQDETTFSEANTVTEGKSHKKKASQGVSTSRTPLAPVNFFNNI